MKTILNWLGLNWIAVAAGAALLALFAGLVVTLKIERNGRIEAEVRASTAEAAAQANFQHALEVERWALITTAEAARLAEETVADVKESTRIVRIVERVPAQPLSPALSCYVDLLYDLEANSAAGTGGSADPEGVLPVREACAPTP
jgi:hypothetical protein